MNAVMARTSGLAAEAASERRHAESAQHGRRAKLKGFTLRVPASTCHLPDGIPRARRNLFAERLFDQRHEDRAAWTWQVRREDLAALHAENARTVDLDRQRKLHSRRFAQESDDPLRVR